MKSFSTNFRAARDNLQTGHRTLPLRAGACALALLATGVVAQAATCTDFLAYANGTALPESFTQDGFRFQDQAGGFAPVVSVFSDGIGQQVHGMQFDGRGLTVKLAKKASKVEIRAVPRLGLTVTATDVAGKVQDQIFIPADDGYLNTRVLTASTARIAQLRIVGGFDAGVLDRVCLTR